MKIHIEGARLIDPVAGTEQPADLFIAAGKIAGIGAPPPGFRADATLDARGLVAAPGLVDLAARVPGPRAHSQGQAACAAEMAAALAGGVTSLVCPPCAAYPLDEASQVAWFKSWACNPHQARAYPLGALSAGLAGRAVAAMSTLAQAGCIGFSQGDAPLADTAVLLCALQYAATFGYTVWLRPQDARLAAGGVAASGAMATRLGLRGVPAAAETIALQTCFELMRATGARVHLVHLSSAAGVALVRAAKKEGLAVSCDVTINHIHLTELDIGYFDTQCRFDPPLRTQRDRDALRAGLADGTIDAICSAHTPLGDAAKQRPFAEAAPGATGLELLLSLVVKWATDARVPLAKAWAKVSAAPAGVLGLQRGRLETGAAADLCLFDPAAAWTVEPAALKSRGRNTPFLGYELPARTRATLVAGQIVYEQH